MSINHIKLERNHYGTIQEKFGWEIDLEQFCYSKIFRFDFKVKIFDTYINNPQLAEFSSSFPSKDLSTIYLNLIEIFKGKNVNILSKENVPTRWLWDISIREKLENTLLFSKYESLTIYVENEGYSPAAWGSRDESIRGSAFTHKNYISMTVPMFLKNQYNFSGYIDSSEITSCIYFFVDDRDAEEALLYWKLQLPDTFSLTQVDYLEVFNYFVVYKTM